MGGGVVGGGVVGGGVVGGGVVAGEEGAAGGLAGAGLGSADGFLGFRHFPAAAFRLLQAPFLVFVECARFLAVAGP